MQHPSLPMAFHRKSPLVGSASRGSRVILNSALTLLFVSVLAPTAVLGQGCDYGPNVFSSLFDRNIPQTCLTMEEDGRTRCYYTYVPDCAQGPTPMLFSPHGLGACPTRVAFQNDWIGKADKECIIIVFPISNNPADSPFDRNCWHVPGGLNLPPAPSGGAKTFPCCCQIKQFPAVDSETYDMLFFRRAAIMNADIVPIQTNGRARVDTKRIYMSGHSNGCIASLGMAKVHSDMVAAVCCTGGVSVTPAADNYIPTPQLTVRGLLDNQVRYDGLFIEGVGLAVPSAQAGFQNTSALNGCTGFDTNVDLVPAMNLGSTEASMTTMTAAGCNATVQLVTFNTAGHQTLNNATEVFPFGAANTTVDVTSILWNFCSRFQKAEQPADFPTTPSPTPDPTTLAPTPTPTTLAPTPSPTTLPPSPNPTTLPPSPNPTTLPPSPNPTTLPPSPNPTSLPPSPNPTTRAPTRKPTTRAPTRKPTTRAPTRKPTLGGRMMKKSTLL